MQNTFLITGATGYIGGSLVRRIVEMNGDEELRLVLLVRNVKKAQEQFADYLGRKEITILFLESRLENMVVDELDIPFPIDYIIHAAAPTASSYMITNPVETADAIVIGTRNVLELAKISKIKSMVYLSSMEIYGNIACREGERITEEKLGYVAVDNPRSCYPLGKRMAEHYCHACYHEYGVPVKIARLSQTFGKGVSQNDNRIFAQIAKAVIEERDIILHTQGMSMGNYCDISDTVDAILTILYKGKSGEVYNVVNEENTMLIRNMAHLVAETVAHGKIRVVYDIDEKNIYGYAADTGLCLSSKKLRALGWQSKKGLKEMYQDLIEWYKQEDLI